jgi:photosystem II stability/assembly factor-like uncharacterized protein
MLAIGLCAGAVPMDACAEATNVPSQPYVWRNVKVVAGGFIPGIVFNATQPGLAYCRTDIGSSYKWDDPAKRWIPLTDWNGVSNLQGTESIATDPLDPNRLYLAQGMYSDGPAAILRSMDQGRTFQKIDVPIRMGANEDGRGVGERLAIDPNDNRILYFGSRYDGLWASKDAALTWNKVESFPVAGSGPQGVSSVHGAGLSFVVFDAGTGARGKATETLYVGSTDRAQGKLYRSTDAGKSWEEVSGQPKRFVPIHAVFDTRGVLYLVYDDGVGPNGITDGAVWKFNPADGAWTDITPVKDPGRPPGGYGGIAVDRQKPGTLVVVSLNRKVRDDDDRMYRTTDGGATWRDITAKTRRDASKSPYLVWGKDKPTFGWWIATVAIDPFDSKRICYATGATIWRSDDIDNADSGKETHWTVWAEGIEETAVLELASPPAGPHLISAFGDIGSFSHDNLDVSPRSGMQLHPLFTTATSLDFAEKNPNIMIRTGSKALHVSDRGTLAYSSDGGRTWAPFTVGDLQFEGGRQTGYGAGSGVIILSADGSTILSALGPVQISRDHGKTWSTVRSLPTGVRPVADRVNPAKFYALSVARGKIYRSTDGGASFTSSAVTGLPQEGGRFFLRPVPGREGDLWLVGSGGMYHSLDGGGTFTQVANAPGTITLGFGMPAPGAKYPALYVAGTYRHQEGLFRSDDAGATWVRINDDLDQWGNRYTCIAGDPRIYGRVYVGTDGRGIFYGDIVADPK